MADMRVLKAEFEKGRRAAPRKIALLAQLPCCLLGLLASGAMPGYSAGWIGYATYGWCYWYTLALPVAIALITASVGNIDAKLGLRSVLGLPVVPAKIWLVKVAYCMVLIFASCLIVGGVSSAAAFAGGSAPGPVPSLIIALLVTATSLWMIPTGLFLVVRAGMLAAIAVPLLIQIAGGIAFGSSPLWWMVPPAVAFRCPSPFSRVFLSGIPLPAGDPAGIVDGTWVAGVALAVAIGLVLVLCGARWFNRREVA